MKRNQAADQPKKFQCEAVAVAYACINPVEVVRIYANGEVVYDVESNSPQIIRKTQTFSQTITFYDGTQVTADPLLESIEGVGNVPAFKEVNYLVFENLSLDRFGGVFPSFTFIVRSKQRYLHAKDVVDDILTNKINLNTEILAYNANTGALIQTDNSLKKLPVNGWSFPMDGTSFLDTLQPYFDSWGVIVEGLSNNLAKVKLTLPIDTLTTTTLETANLAADISLMVSSGLYKITDLGVEKAPNQLALTYRDINRDCEQEVITVQGLRSEDVNTTNVSVNFPLTRQNASTMSQRLLRRTDMIKNQLSFTVPVSYLTSFVLRQGSLVRLTGDTYLDNKTWLIDNLTIGDSGFVEIEAYRFNPVVYAYVSGTSNNVAASTPNPTTEVNFDALLIDAPIFKSETSTNRLLPWLAVDSNNSGSTYHVYVSTDDVNYTFAYSSNEHTPIGTVNVLNYTNSDGIPDFNANMEIQFPVGSTNFLATGDPDDLMNESNVVYYQNGYIAYQNATLSAPQTWQVESLTIGILNSAESINPSVLGEKCAVVSATHTRHNILPSPTYSGDLYIKITKVLGDYANQNSIQVLSSNYQANCLLALAPQTFPYVFTAPNDYTFNWTPCSTNRTNNRIVSNAARSSNPDGSVYIIDVNNVSNNLLTSSTTSGSTFTFTTTTKPDSFNIKQNNGVYGSGSGFTTTTTSL